ncbi:hypothetical protein HF521_001834 [Silurus meridionalis]|uniref:Choline transporter-like protein n=1 Tax=Silurus meridionalis TaxID=175797 RepID=A0A8T0BAB1_SILME|nr:hypothetical protein HF521_001834 [Silurus meridionalis]
MGKKTEDKEQQQEPSEYGEPTPYDPTFAGPIHNRSCTDIICCVLFMLVLVGYMVVGILAWLYGDPRHVLFPRNSTGMFCGLPPNQNKPNVFYFNILKCATATNIMAAALQGLQCPTTQICLSSCPSDFWSLNPIAYAAPPSDLYKYFKQELCVPSFNLSTTTLRATEIINMELCSFFYTPTTSVLGRCLPSLGPAYTNIPLNFSLPGMSNNQTVNTIKNATGDLVGGFNARDVGVRIFADFASTWQWIVLGLVIAMVVSLLFLILLRFLAAILVWILIIGVLVVGAFGIWYCYNQYALLANSTLTYNNVGFTTNVNVYLQIRDTWLAFLIILCVVEAILLLTLIFLRTRILIAIAVIQESSKAVGHMMSTLFYPIITFVMLLVCVSYWGITALYLATSGGPVYNVVALNSSDSSCSSITGNQSCDPTTFNSSVYGSCQSARCMFIKYNTDGLFQRNLFNLQLYNVVGFLWCVNFVIALGQCTLAGARLLLLGLPQTLRHPNVPSGLLLHEGTAVSRRLSGLRRSDSHPRANSAHHSGVHRPQVQRGSEPLCSVSDVLSEVLFLLSGKIHQVHQQKRLHHDRHLRQKLLCLGQNAFSLLMRNIIRVVVLDKVTDLLLFFGKLLVVGGVGALAFYFFSGNIPNSPITSSSLNYYWMPIIAVVFGAYLIASAFFSVYSMCVDTLFLCFLEDLERNDGSAEKPYYMSKNLMKILNKKNKQPKK